MGVKSDLAPKPCRVCGDVSKVAHYIIIRHDAYVEYVRACRSCLLKRKRGELSDETVLRAAMPVVS